MSGGMNAGGGYEKYMREVHLKSLSSYAIKSTIHTISIKNISVFPIHKVRIEIGGNGKIAICDGSVTVMLQERRQA